MSRPSTQFSQLALLLHWLIAIATTGLFGLGVYMVELTYYDPLYQTLPHIHKSAGILLALVLLLGIARKFFGHSPPAIEGGSRLIIVASRAAHWLMWILVVLISASGYLISTADGAGIDVFNLFSVPATVTTIPGQEDLAGTVHWILAYILTALVALHIAAALKHHFVNKDATLRRMLGMNKSTHIKGQEKESRRWKE